MLYLTYETTECSYCRRTVQMSNVTSIGLPCTHSFHSVAIAGWQHGNYCVVERKPMPFFMFVAT